MRVRLSSKVMRETARFKKEPMFGTGHRPDKLGDPHWVSAATECLLKWYRPPVVYVGMALGFDTILALKCRELEIPYEVVIPFVGQEKLWPEADQRLFFELCDAANDRHVLSTHMTKHAFQVRNAWMVDQSRHGIACWDSSRGGTWNCVMYAKATHRHVTVMDPLYRTVSTRA